MAASQVVPRGVYKKESVVRGHHIYKTVWTPVIGEELPVEREEDNQHDQHAVAVVKNGDIVGHMPRSISRVSCFFLERFRAFHSLEFVGCVIAFSLLAR